MNKGPRRGRDRLLAGASLPGTASTGADATAIVTDPPVAPADVVPAPPAGAEPDNAAVLPDPTLTAEPGAPQPIVTASPVLAAEPSAIDVVQADAAADRVAAGVGDEADREAAHPAVAGQPTLTIEGATAASVAASIADGAISGIGDAARDALGERPLFYDDVFDSRHHEHSSMPELRSPSLIEADLEDLAARDPARLQELLRRFYDGARLGVEPVRDRTVVGDRSDVVRIVEVVGPAKGRRRAGMMFGPQARRFLAGDLREDELDALLSDPQLAVGITEMDAAEADVTFADTILPSG